MTQPTTGVLAIWHDVEADAQATADFFEWYNRQHHLERLDVPGFVRARRYEALQGAPRIFSRYDTETPEVLASAAYRARLENPSEWTRRCMPRYRNMARTVCRVVHRFGRGEGGKVAALRFDAGPGSAQELIRWAVDDALGRIESLPGIVGGQFLAAADDAATTKSSEEMRIRGAEDARDGLVLLVTGTSAAAVSAAADVLAAPEALAAHGMSGALRQGLYELVFDARAAP